MNNLSRHLQKVSGIPHPVGTVFKMDIDDITYTVLRWWWEPDEHEPHFRCLSSNGYYVSFIWTDDTQFIKQ